MIAVAAVLELGIARNAYDSAGARAAERGSHGRSGMRRIAGCIPIVLASSGCPDVELVATELVRASEVEGGVCIGGPAKLDILLVIDDSPSMSDTAAVLADNLAAFAERFEEPDVRFDYRVAVTTTNVAHPWCDASPEDGAFVASSCRARLDDFAIEDSHEGPAVDLRTVCADACSREDLGILPTALFDGGERVPRPWLERMRGVRNLPDAVSTAEALTCLGEVGVAGCTFESPLEAAYLALLRTFDRDDPAYGFLRDDAALFVLFIGDEADCSVRPQHADIFDPAGDRALWEPGTSTPTSAICWHAGMRCEGEGPIYDDCVAASIGRDGTVVGDDDAVLQPLSRYRELLRQIERHKQEANGDDDRHVFVHVLGGVPPSFGQPEPPLYFAEAADAIERRAFGIAAGCRGDADAPGAAAGVVAYPPGRLREIAEQFQRYDAPTFSLCDADYTDALACVPGSRRVPQCVDGCAADRDPDAAGIQHDCVLTETLTARGDQHDLAECERDDAAAPDDRGASAWRIPDGAQACVWWTHGDLLDRSCGERGNVGFGVLRRVPLEEPVCLRAVCSASQMPGYDCPYP